MPEVFWTEEKLDELANIMDSGEHTYKELNELLGATNINKDIINRVAIHKRDFSYLDKVVITAPTGSRTRLNPKVGRNGAIVIPKWLIEENEAMAIIGQRFEVKITRNKIELKPTDTEEYSG